MEFDWDAANLEHIGRHDVSPVECEQAYSSGPLVIEHQLRRGEVRRLCLGETSEGRLLAFVVTERKGKVRFVTAYTMHQKQREFYLGEE